MLTYEFFCGLRGFHVYCARWKPKVADKILIVHEKGNPHEENAMAGKKTLAGTLAPSIIGHIPKEISRYTRYIAEHGARVSAFVVSSTHRRSPLVQVGLEIQIGVVVKPSPSAVNESNLEKYKAFVNDNTKNQLTESMRMRRAEF